MGIPRHENRAKDHVFRIDAPRDNKHAFDHYVRSYHVDSIYHQANVFFLSESCRETVTMLEKEVLKNFIMQWVDVVQESAVDFERQKEANPRVTEKVHSREQHHWAVDTSNGDVLAVEGKVMDPKFVSCWGIISAFNTEWEFADDQQRDTTDIVRKHVEEYFDIWYTEVVHATNVEDGKA